MPWTLDEVKKIREAICSIEIKGYDNALRVVYAVQECDKVIAALSKTLNGQNGVGEDVTPNAESHTG